MNDCNVYIAWLTGLLAIATVWLAIATHLMAKVAKKSIELETIPYLCFSDIRVVFGLPRPETLPAESQTVVSLGISLKNPGKVRVKYKVKSLIMTLNALTIPNPTMTNDGSFIYPGDISIFWYGKIFHPGIISTPAQGTAEFEIHYWSVDGSKPSFLKQKLNFTVFSFEPPYYEWVNIYEEHSA